MVSLQRMEDKLKAVTKENSEMREKITSHPPLKKLKSLNDLDQANEEQETEFLKLQVIEQQNIIDELTRDREKLIRRRKHRRSSKPIKVMRKLGYQAFAIHKHSQSSEACRGIFLQRHDKSDVPELRQSMGFICQKKIFPLDSS
nr:janus kinase and microtubule-interacting protein 2-like [Odocoileus virginianus texanus]